MSEKKTKKKQAYTGFEQGPIRPPSEARSLLIRVTRNCPWNHCTFCPVYKGSKFSLRPKEHVLMDIDEVFGHLGGIIRMASAPGGLTSDSVNRAAGGLDPAGRSAFAAALNWYTSGMESIFIQDANSLIIKPEELIEILEHLKNRFPWTKRVTSYARSHTIARIAQPDLDKMAKAGLNRIHIGMESGSDKVLEKVCKGTTKQMQITAGKKVLEAGMELSEYIMPGLGGKDLSQEHAVESADALNQIDPHFIRLRSLAVAPGTPLFDQRVQGDFVPLPDAEVAREILTFIQNLTGIRSQVASDHILNLFEDLEGPLPEKKDEMVHNIQSFLGLDPEKKTLFQVGRRIGAFRGVKDLDNPDALARAQTVIDRFSITPENVDEKMYEILQSFI